MLFKKVDFPDSLINAQKNGNLVVFAGAGVSMGPPANYPNFAKLANQVASGVMEQEENEGQKEPIDRFLGRLEEKGILVHQKTYDILSNPASQPNLLHSELLKLFLSASKVRLVTTNFDIHFNTAAFNIWEDNIETFYAPALPLGDDFNGIVYLHGSVKKKAKNLIITDKDFGRAYVTQGWASRFLQSMFLKYTVLFVGYSYNDPVVPYLTRGLPNKRLDSRFALVKEDDNPERWIFLGITPIKYPLQPGENRHIALGEAITDWVKHLQMGTLDHERRVREIVELPPPIDLEDADYIENAIKNLVTVRFFTRYAKLANWLEWAENKGLFQELFQLNIPISEIGRQIGVWFSQNFVCDYPDKSLTLVQRQQQVLNPFLWNAIAHRLATKNPRPDSKTIAKWVLVLISYQHPEYQLNLLSDLLDDCQPPKDNVTALLLFEYLTKPKLLLRQSFRISTGDNQEVIPVIDYEISVSGSFNFLAQSWQELFKPNLAAFAQELEPFLTSHLKQAHLLLKSVEKVDETFCILSYHRSAIEPHEQNRFFDEGMDILIDAARDVLEWLLMNKPDYGHSLIHIWSESEVFILKRLAIHGLAESTRLTSDEKISWLLEKDWLNIVSPKHEVFRLLKNAYPKASESYRLRLLEQIEQPSNRENTQNLEQDVKEREYRQYQLYNLLSWLHKAAPECSLVSERLEAIQQAYPSWKPREHPDLNSRTTSYIAVLGSDSPITVDELLAQNPQEKIDWILSYWEEGSLGSRRDHLLAAVREAVKRSYEWGWQLVSALQSKKAWDSDVWQCIFYGWQQGNFTEQQWKDVLDLLNAQPQIYKFAERIADVLLQGVSDQTSQSQIPTSYLPLAANLAEQLWSSCSNGSTKHMLETEDWLSEAINHPGGKLVNVWLYSLSKLRAENKDSLAGIPSQYKIYFRKILIETSDAASLGRVVLASQTHFLLALDVDWTKDNILPLLDWDNDLKQAKQAWHGFLNWGRWNENVLPHLLPLYEKTFSHVSTDFGRSNFRERFSNHIAGIAVYGFSDPLQNGWLRKFLQAVPSEDRKSWAYYISHILMSMEEDAAKNLWERWLKTYWEERIAGVPLSLKIDELEVMFEWSIYLKPVFAEVVEKICQSPVPNSQNISYFFSRLGEKGYANSHPEALTRLLLYLLSNATSEYFWFQNVENLVRDLAHSSALRKELKQICNELSRLGAPYALELSRFVEENAD